MQKMDSNSNSTTADQFPPWSDLPLDLLLKIRSFIGSRVGRLRFRSVCKSWRSSNPKPSPSLNTNLVTLLIPYPAPADSLFRNSSIKPPLVLSQSEIYYLFDPSGRSFTSSVVAVEEGVNGEMRARHPMSDKNIGNSRKVLDLENVGVVQVGKLFHLKCFSGGRTGYVDYARVVASLDDNDDVKQSLNLVSKSSSLASFSDVCVVGIFGEKLMCYRFKEDVAWVTVIHGGPRFPYSDVIYRKGKFYAVDEARRLVIVDSLMNVEVVNSPDVLSAGLMSHSDTSYLVNLGGELHLVVLYYGEEDDIRNSFNTKFLVYRFKEAERDWVRVMDLGDWAIFVSRFGSFGVCVSEISLCQKNCIYFQLDIQTECSSFAFCKDDVCFTAVFDVAKGICDDFACNFNSPASAITWNLRKCKFKVRQNQENC